MKQNNSALGPEEITQSAKCFPCMHEPGSELSHQNHVKKLDTCTCHLRTVKWETGGSLGFKPSSLVQRFQVNSRFCLKKKNKVNGSLRDDSRG